MFFVSNKSFRCFQQKAFEFFFKKNHLGTDIIYTNEANERKFIIPKWIFFFL